MDKLAEKILNNVRGAKPPEGAPQPQPQPPPPQQQPTPPENSEAKSPPPDSQKATEADAFAKMRIALKEKERALDEAAKVTDHLKRSLEILQKEKEELSNTLAKIKFTESPVFKEKYQAPVERARARLTEYAALYKISDDDMKKLMSDPDIKSRYETAGKLFGAAAPLVVQTLDQLRISEAEMKKAVEEWQQAAPQHMLDIQRAEKSARVAKVVESIDQAAEELRASVAYLQPSQVDAKWNENRSALLAHARKLAEVDDPVQTAAVLIKAALFDQAYADLLKLMKEHKELAAKYGEVESSFPTLRSAPPPQRTVPEKTKEETGPVSPSRLVAEIIAKKLQKSS